MIAYTSMFFEEVISLLNLKKTTIMKTIIYLLLALFMTASFTACTTDSVADNVNLDTETVATGGDGHVDPDEDGDIGGN